MKEEITVLNLSLSYFERETDITQARKAANFGSISSSSSSNFLRVQLIAVSGVQEFLSITYMNIDPIGASPLTFCHQSEGASSKDNTGPNMGKHTQSIHGL